MSTIENISLHLVGNSGAAEGVVLAQEGLQLSDIVRELLTDYFLSPFSSEELFELYHDSGIEFNVVYGAASRIFDDPETLHEQSVNLAKHLYEQSSHPKIKGGEFYTVY
ncbi:MAG: nucleoid-associated protein, partial [Bacteroidales bacterium]|nr:nucleoid-associated protein [Bacteroidales bacterium]